MQIEVKNVKQEGDCNFCTRNPGEKILVCGGRTLSINICDRCLAELKQHSPANSQSRTGISVKNAFTSLPEYTYPKKSSL